MIVDALEGMATGSTANPSPALLEKLGDNLRKISKRLGTFSKITTEREIIVFRAREHVDVLKTNHWFRSCELHKLDSPVLDLLGCLNKTVIEAYTKPCIISRIQSPQDSTNQTILACIQKCETAALKGRDPEWIPATKVQSAGPSTLYEPLEPFSDIVLIPGIMGDPWETWSTSSRN
jgi:hypothetical protein